jgi:lipopolysaccharide/colanic/teichoic acid biosynthesis glycosyltransferase
MYVSIKINRSFDSFTLEEQQKFLNTLSAVMDMSSGFNVEDVRRGCVELILRMTPAEAERLTFLTQQGELESLAVMEVKRVRRKHSAPVREPIQVAQELQPSKYFRWNWLLNRFVGAVLLVLAAPIILLSVLAVFLTSRGAPFYRQKRVGKGGRTFTIYKIRTMRNDAEARTGPVWTTSSRDPRITPVGRFLRNTGLDELPQLFNVLVGEMALVGPSPERPEFAQALANEIPGYLDRLYVLPGMTGLAQVNLPTDTDFDSVRRKLAVDLVYISRASFWLDLRLVLATVAPLLGVPGAWANRVLGVSYQAPQAGDIAARYRRSIEHD